MRDTNWAGNVDIVCKRYGVDNSHRDLHGALLDAEILADVYLAMTGGQTLLSLEPESEEPALSQAASAASLSLPVASALRDRPRLKVVRCSEQEEEAHQKRLGEIAKASGGNCLWPTQA